MTQENHREFVVTAADARTRVDRFLAKTAREFSRSRIQALIRQGHVRVNGSVPCARDMVRTGDRIALVEPPMEAIDLAREKIYQRTAEAPLEIPAGAVVVPGSRNVRGEVGRAWGLSLYAPVIVKYRDEKTERAIQLEDYLR